MEGLYKRGRIWWVRFTPRPGHPQQFASTGESDLAQAVLRARDIKDRMSRETVIEMDHGEVELERYIKAMQGKKLSASTIEAKGYILSGFLKAMPVTLPRKITLKAVKDWFDSRLELNEHTAVAYLNGVRW